MILDLLKNDHHDLKYVARTNGGEWAGPCPWCGGHDRFRVWPDQGRYWCRQCNRSGDAARYLHQFKGMSPEDIQSKYNLSTSRCPVGGKWEPKGAIVPNSFWQAAAESFLLDTQRNLWSKHGNGLRQWLGLRGLSGNTIKSAGLGFNFKNQNQARHQWGLKSNGGFKNVWLPPGLAIPYHRLGEILRLRIRRNGGRYVVISGSSSAPMVWDNKHDLFVVVESELDGMLLNQEAGNLVNVAAIGSVSIKPDVALHEKLLNCRLILVSLDADKAGIRTSYKWWLRYYDQARRWPVPVGKDPSEAYEQGLDIRVWIQAGLL